MQFPGTCWGCIANGDDNTSMLVIGGVFILDYMHCGPIQGS